MNHRRLKTCVLSVSLAGVTGVGITAVLEGSWRASALHAQQGNPFQDSDQDLLPDSLEWVALTNPSAGDSDGNGMDDFLQTVQHLAPFSQTARPDQDEVRVLVSSFGTGDEAEVYVHMLFRFVGGRIGNVQSMVPFLSLGTLHNAALLPIDQLIGSGPICVRSSFNAAIGTRLIVSARIARANELAFVLPCAICAEAVIDGKRYTSGTYLTGTDGQQVALVPISGNRFIAQPLAGDEGASNPFWNSNSVCTMSLDVVGAGLAGILCEVSAADCEVANGLRCAPSCKSSLGRMVFVPDGLSTLTGG